MNVHQAINLAEKRIQECFHSIKLEQSNTE